MFKSIRKLVEQLNYEINQREHGIPELHLEPTTTSLYRS